MTAQHYYIEIPYGGVFAIVEPEILEIVKNLNEKHFDEELYIRPVHDEENWDETIKHEQRADKRYRTISDEDDAKDFLDW